MWLLYYPSKEYILIISNDTFSNKKHHVLKTYDKKEDEMAGVKHLTILFHALVVDDLAQN